MPDPLLGGLVATGASTFGRDLVSLGGKALRSVFGGNGGPNIARSLSRQVGFTVLQSDAATVRARISAGLDPRTGQPVSNRVALAKPPVPDVRIGNGSTAGFFKDLVATGAANIINAKLAPSETGIRMGGLPPGFPTPSIETLKTPALPRRVPVPPGGGRVSLIPTAGMASVGAIARMGGRGLMRTSTGRVSGIVLASGQRFSRKNAASLIRRVGFEAAAIALGITIVEAAEILLAESQKRSRGRGITAAQVRNARRTTCAVARLARDLGVKPAPVRRKTSCR